MKNEKSYEISLFLISSALLSLEIALMRVLRVEGFGNFTFSAIAIALTGFGAGGTIVFLLRPRFRGRERLVCAVSSVVFIFTLGFGFWISKEITFDPLRIAWDVTQLHRLLLRYFIYAVPFIAGSIFVVLSFTILRPGRAYFFNLTGSGLGVGVILLCFYVIDSHTIFIVPMLFAIACFALLIIGSRLSVPSLTLFIALIAAGFGFFSKGFINILPYKGIMLALNFPDARIDARRISPFGTLEVVKSSMIRGASGLSLAFSGRLPDQMGLFLDGDRISTIDRIEGMHSLHYLRYQPQSAVYALHTHPSVFQIGLGGGGAAARAVLHSAKNIVISEQNPQLIELLARTYAHYNDSLMYTPGLEVVRTGARNYLRKSDLRWDVIEISEPDGRAASVGGIYATDTDYTMTVEACEEFVSRLSERGTLSVTVLLKYPPRKLLKIVAIAKTALEKMNLDPEKNILVLRGWASGTVLVKKTPFTEEDIEKIRRFCAARMFDIVYFHGMHPSEANQYNVVKDAYYSVSVREIFTNFDRFTAEYPFNIEPNTDNRPFFGYFFRVKKIVQLYQQVGHQWMLAIEGGYLILFSTFVVTVFIAFALILAPLSLAGKRIRGGALKIFLYFCFIALSYMCVEIVIINKYTRYLVNPIYSSSVTIATLVVSSGFGSRTSDRLARLNRKILMFPVFFIVAYFTALLLLVDRVYQSFDTASLLPMILFSMLLLAPLGFAMGFPFPLALSRLRGRGDDSVPWAWSINSYFSVIASTGAVIIASNAGFLWTGLSAVLLYAGSIFVFPD
jgi:hypothetical protein